MNRKSLSILKLSKIEQGSGVKINQKRVSFNKIKNIRIIKNHYQSAESDDLRLDKEENISDSNETNEVMDTDLESFEQSMKMSNIHLQQRLKVGLETESEFSVLNLTTNEKVEELKLNPLTKIQSDKSIFCHSFQLYSPQCRVNRDINVDDEFLFPQENDLNLTLQEKFYNSQNSTKDNLDMNFVDEREVDLYTDPLKLSSMKNSASLSERVDLISLCNNDTGNVDDDSKMIADKNLNIISINDQYNADDGDDDAKIPNKNIDLHWSIEATNDGELQEQSFRNISNFKNESILPRNISDNILNRYFECSFLSKSEATDPSLNFDNLNVTLNLRSISNSNQDYSSLLNLKFDGQQFEERVEEKTSLRAECNLTELLFEEDKINENNKLSSCINDLSCTFNENESILINDSPRLKNSTEKTSMNKCQQITNLPNIDSNRGSLAGFKEDCSINLDRSNDISHYQSTSKAMIDDPFCLSSTAQSIGSIEEFFFKPDLVSEIANKNKSGNVENNLNLTRFLFEKEVNCAGQSLDLSDICYLDNCDKTVELINDDSNKENDDDQCVSVNDHHKETIINNYTLVENESISINKLSSLQNSMTSTLMSQYKQISNFQNIDSILEGLTKFKEDGSLTLDQFNDISQYQTTPEVVIGDPFGLSSIAQNTESIEELLIKPDSVSEMANKNKRGNVENNYNLTGFLFKKQVDGILKDSEELVDNCAGKSLNIDDICYLDNYDKTIELKNDDSNKKIDGQYASVSDHHKEAIINNYTLDENESISINKLSSLQNSMTSTLMSQCKQINNFQNIDSILEGLTKFKEDDSLNFDQSNDITHQTTPEVVISDPFGLSSLAQNTESIEELLIKPDIGSKMPNTNKGNLNDSKEVDKCMEQDFNDKYILTICDKTVEHRKDDSDKENEYQRTSDNDFQNASITDINNYPKTVDNLCNSFSILQQKDFCLSSLLNSPMNYETDQSKTRNNKRSGIGTLADIYQSNSNHEFKKCRKDSRCVGDDEDTANNSQLPQCSSPIFAQIINKSSEIKNIQHDSRLSAFNFHPVIQSDIFRNNNKLDPEMYSDNLDRSTINEFQSISKHSNFRQKNVQNKFKANDERINYGIYTTPINKCKISRKLNTHEPKNYPFCSSVTSCRNLVNNLIFSTPVVMSGRPLSKPIYSNYLDTNPVIIPSIEPRYVCPPLTYLKKIDSAQRQPQTQKRITRPITTPPSIDIKLLNEKSQEFLNNLDVSFEDIVDRHEKLLSTNIDTIMDKITGKMKTSMKVDEKLLSRIDPEIVRLFLLHIGTPQLKLMREHYNQKCALVDRYVKTMENIRKMKNNLERKCQFCSVPERVCQHKSQLKALVDIAKKSMFNDYKLIQDTAKIKMNMLASEGQCRIKEDFNRIVIERKKENIDRERNRKIEEWDKKVQLAEKKAMKIKNLLENFQTVKMLDDEKELLKSKSILFNDNREQKVKALMEFILDCQLNPLRERLKGEDMTTYEFKLMGSRLTINVDTTDVNCEEDDDYKNNKNEKAMAVGSTDHYLKSATVEVDDILGPMKTNIGRYFQELISNNLINKSIDCVREMFLLHQMPILLLLGDVNLCSKYRHLIIYWDPDIPFRMKAQIVRRTPPPMRFAIFFDLHPIAQYQSRPFQYEIQIDFDNANEQKIRKILDEADDGMNKLYRMFGKLFRQMPDIYEDNFL